MPKLRVYDAARVCAKMQDPQNLLRVTLQAIRDAVVTTDRSARVLMLNPAAESLCGWKSGEAAGKPVDEVLRLATGSLAAADAATLLHSLLRPVQNALSQGVRTDQPELLVILAKDGRRVPAELTAFPLVDAGGAIEGCVLVLHDMSRAMELAERISYVAQHDPLTGLPNRILLVDRLEQGTKVADRNNERLAVMFVGLNQISRIKSEIGNAAADEMLKEIAFRIIGITRESDTVCRLGLDEFVIVALGVRSLSDVEAVATKLMEEIAKPHAVGEQTLQTTCSVGISVYPQDASDAATLMRLADSAMHKVRNDKVNRCLFVNSAADELAAVRPAGDAALREP